MRCEIDFVPLLSSHSDHPVMLGKRTRARVESEDEGSGEGPSDTRARQTSRTMTVTLVASDGGRFDIEACKLWGARYVAFNCIDWLGVLTL